MSWRRFIRREAWDDERAREITAHLEHEIDDNLARGMAPDEARTAAQRALGNVTLVREEIYRMNTLQRSETLWQDVRYALRLLRRSPAFTAVALLSLALGIGANTAIFELLDAVRLRSLPVSRPEEFVEVRISNATHGRTGNFSARHSMLTGPIWARLQNHPELFSTLFAWAATRFDVSDSGESRGVDGVWVSGSFFDALSVRPVLGRLVQPSDDTRGCGSPPVVISEGLWQRQFGGDHSVVGRVIHLDGVPFQIAGVSPAAFRGVEIGHAFDVAVPICAEPIVSGADSRLDRLDAWWLGVIGRLAPSVSREQASIALASLSPAIFQTTVSPRYSTTDATNYRTFTLAAFPAATGVSDLRSQYEQPLWFLLGIAGLVLLIACGNLANLLMARATVREREMAIRLAIGASRMRLCRQLMVESLLLAVTGAAAGAWLAGAVSRALVTLLSTPDNALSFDLDLDWRVFAFAVGVGALTCLAFGLLPAIRATRTAPAGALRAGGRGLTDSREGFGARRILVVGQIALSLVLCVSALLFIRTFWNLATVDPGFRLDGLLVADVDYTRAGIPPDRQRDYQAALTSALAALPGVSGSASASIVPLTGNGSNDTLVLDGKPQKPYPNLETVSGDYFQLLAIPVRAGRSFEARDTMATPRVAMVDQAFARTFFPGAPVVGRTFTFESAPNAPSPTYEIIGVVGDTKYMDLHDPVGPIIYFPSTQDPQPGSGVSVLLRSSAGRSATAAAIVAAVRRVSPVARVSVHELGTLARASIVREEVMATLAGFFGLLAGLLAAVGLYGVMSYGVSRRRGEIGLRMALGAGRPRVLRLILGEASVLVGVGLGLGTGLALLTARSAQTLLFNLKPYDPLTLGASVLLMVAIATLASLLPAVRAARLEPTAALKED